LRYSLRPLRVLKNCILPTAHCILCAECGMMSAAHFSKNALSLNTSGTRGSMTSTPARPGQFGAYGGSYIPETLAPAVAALEAAYAQAKADPAFWEELEALHRSFTGRPTALTYASRLTAHCGGARIYLKREDLA